MGEYLLHNRFDCWIVRDTLPWHIVAQLVSAQNETLLWLAAMNYVKLRTHCKAQHLMAKHGKTRNYILEADLRMDASQNLKE